MKTLRSIIASETGFANGVSPMLDDVADALEIEIRFSKFGHQEFALKAMRDILKEASNEGK